jgi:hypothetical protein
MFCVSLYAKMAARRIKITRPSRMGPMKEARAARIAASMSGLAFPDVAGYDRLCCFRLGWDHSQSF